MPPARLRPRIVRLAACGLATLALTGCVERRYTIRTNPPGALVIVNGEEIGTTPVSRSFVYYGDREIYLIADGYKTQRIIQPIKAPLYDNAVTGIVSENLLPFTIRDEREFVYNLEESRPEESKNVSARAEALRSRGQAPPPPRRGGILGFFGF